MASIPHSAWQVDWHPATLLKSSELLKDSTNVSASHDDPELCLRSDLAICKNWTPDFDSYAILPLRPVDNLVAWVGKIKRQHYYSEPDRAAKDYAEKKAAHDLARSAISLLGGELQFIVIFTHEQNLLHRSRMLGPFAF